MDNFTTIYDHTSLEPDAVVLTVNNRLKQSLHSQYAKNQHTSSWAAPEIFTLKEWAQDCFAQACFAGIIPIETYPKHILSPLAQQYVFEEIIKDSLTNPLLSTRELGRYAVDAYRQIREYQIKPEQVHSYFIHQECQYFLNWQQRYQRLCEENHWLDDTAILVTLAHYDLTPLLPQKLYLAGFENPSPLLDQLFNSLQATFWQTETTTAQTFSYACENIEQEMQHAICWAQQQYEADPACRIGILVPQLEKVQPQLKHILKQQLYPQHSGLFTENYVPIHNFSLGMPLQHYELVATALLWLEVLTSTEAITYQHFSTVLNSPYWQHDLEAAASRTLADIHLRETLPPKYTTAQWLVHLQRFLPTAPAWLEQLQTATQTLDTGLHSPKHWAQQFIQTLATLGFEQFTQSSLNAQLLLGLQQALDTLSGYHDITAPLSASAACNLLKHIAKQQTFQFKSRDQAPIQIMGLLESTGQRFDQVWLLQANQHSFPAPARPNPLLPIELQTAHAMPHTSNAHELAYTQALLARICQSSHTVICSYACHDETGSIRLPSSLIQHFTPAELTFDLPIFKAKALKLETVIDQTGVPLTPPCPLPQASAFLKAQAICPLMAYALFRLKATDVPKPQAKLNPLSRGIWLHHVLEKLLPDLQQGHLPGVEDITAHLPHSLSTPLAKLESLRIHHLLEDWLNLVETNLPTTTLAQEKTFAADLAGLQFSLRIDRIDLVNQTDGNGWLLIDYKTGSSSKPGGWFDARLTEPQLPLYAISAPEAVAGIAFGQLSPNKVKFPYSACLSLPGKHKSPLGEMTLEAWQEQLNSWQQKLNTLATEIIHAEASLTLDDPKIIEAVKHSPAGGFCRVYQHD